MSYLNDFYHALYYYRKFDYHTSFGLILSIEFFLKGLMFLVSCLIIRKINDVALRSTVSSDSQVQKKADQEVTSLIYAIPYYILQSMFSLIKKLMTGMHWLVSFLATFCFGLIPAVLNGFHLISFNKCIILTTFIYTVYFFTFVLRDVPFRKIKSEPGYELLKVKGLKRWIVVVRIAFLKYPVFYFVLAFTCLFLALVVPLLLDELCVCFFCEYGVVMSSAHDRISSRMLRKYTLPDACPPGVPCHVYTTLPEDGSKSVFINAHTSVETETLTVLYAPVTTEDPEARLQPAGAPYSHKLDIEKKGDRYMHSVYIGDLNPNTEYYFEIHYNNIAQYSNKFRTLPSKEMEREIVVVSGGDVSANERAQKMTDNLVALEPDVIFVDGDAAYDDGMRACYYSYDTFIDMFESLNEKLGYMVPLVISAGNHDLGVNGMNEAPIARKDDGPLYFTYFPQHSTLGDAMHTIPSVPDLAHRKTYFHHIIGNTLHVSMDTGYDVHHGDFQARWLDKVSYTYSNYPKFAHYHIPLYPACEDEQDMLTVQKEEMIQAWTPIFEGHHYQAAFENHVHMMKKTYPLKKGAVHSDGVIYFGDGNWGVHPHPCPANGKPVNEKIFERVGDESHVWIMHVSKDGWEHYPIGLEGELLMDRSYKNF